MNQARGKQNTPKVDSAQHKATAVSPSDKITLTTREDLHVVDLSEIVHLEADQCYTSFYLVNQPRIVVCNPLKKYAELLPASSFFRIHQSYIINLKYLRKISRIDSGYRVILMDGKSLPIARRKREALVDVIKRNTLF